MCLAHGSGAQHSRSNADGQPTHTCTGVLIIKILQTVQAGWKTTSLPKSQCHLSMALAKETHLPPRNSDPATTTRERLVPQDTFMPSPPTPMADAHSEWSAPLRAPFHVIYRSEYHPETQAKLEKEQGPDQVGKTWSLTLDGKGGHRVVLSRGRARTVDRFKCLTQLQGGER